MGKYIIGISAFYHDSSACLFEDGKLVFACEEERFTGIKHDNSFPEKTLDFIFKKYSLNRENVEAVCYYEDPKLKQKRVLKNSINVGFKNPRYSIISLIDFYRTKKKISSELKKISNNIFYSPHHESHQYYSYFNSDYRKSVCLSVDGVGESATTVVGYHTNDLSEFKTISQYPHSLGLFYSAMTGFLGFKPNEGEYKVMGLASYGDPNTCLNKMKELITYKNGELKCNMDVFTWNRDNKIMFNYKLGLLLDTLPRTVNDPITQIHKNLAAAVQKQYEDILFKILKDVSVNMKTKNICMGGGCAYNGTANGKITKQTPFKYVWIPSAPSDAGSAVGACINYLLKNNKLKERLLKTPFLGPEFNSNEIYEEIKNEKFRYFDSKDKLYDYIAEKIDQGMVVGWYSGKMEFGARALGGRSILADPRPKKMKNKINSVIKKREGFRPFAPMVIKEKQHEFFNVYGDVPYMNQVVEVKKEFRNKGYGAKLIEKSNEYLFSNHDVEVHNAYIKPNNAPSMKVFEKIGYINHGIKEVNGQHVYHLTFSRCQI